MTPLTIRPAQAEDLPDLLALYRHLVPEDPPTDLNTATTALDRLALWPGSAVFLAFAHQTLAASCTLIVAPNLTRQGQGFGLIENVVTHPDFRNQGIGKRLLAAAEQAAWDAGCYKVMLMTGSSRPETLHFYHSAGYAQSKTGFQKRRIPPRSGA